MHANFTPRCQEILSLSKKLAFKFSHKKVSLEHFLLSFLKMDLFLIPFLKLKLGADLTGLEILLVDSLNQTKKSKLDSLNDVVYDDSVKSCLDQSYKISNENNHSYISVEHVLYAMLFDSKSDIIDYFIICDIDVEALKKFLKVIFADQISEEYTESSLIGPIESPANTKNSKPIESYSINLNSLALDGKFDFLHTNEAYQQAIEETLCRKTKSCALLVGDPGVGKTALVENLAKNIIDLKTNDYLINKKVLALDLSSMVAGTKFRGQFEERLKSFVDSIINENDIILFIDEIHTIVGAGNAEGSLDASNILKPYIARGDITCIGATTYDEYKKHFSKDPALKRRFNLIKIQEPNREESIKILENLCEEYEIFHRVDYSEESLIAAVDLSLKYINDRKLPDKAIDLLDQAGAVSKIKNFKKPKIAKQMEKVLLDNNIDESIKANVYSNYKDTVYKWGEKKDKSLPVITALDMKKIISKNYDIPMEVLNEVSSKKLINLKNKMSRNIIGQPEAVEKICNALYKSHAGLKDEHRPIGSFLFLGKTGIGKTLTSKMLAKFYFGSSKKLISFDMSDFSESYSVSKLSGSAPGYVGYEKGGLLTEAIKKDPYSVLLFDEIEKAHPVVLQSLLQILEEGRLVDNNGEETSFKNTIIILTSNLGADIIDKKSTVGFSLGSDCNFDKVFEQAKKQLSPELVNRFDSIILFNNMDEQSLKKIINLEFNKLKNKLNLKKIKCSLMPKARLAILEKVLSENLGGRPVRRIIQNEIEVLVAKFIISDNNVNNLIINFKNNIFTCEHKTPV